MTMTHVILKTAFKHFTRGITVVGKDEDHIHITKSRKSKTI
jgi:hypothetical protein